ncbi:MAG: hypothetical protein E3J40_01925 [Dehalococcoidia bacterium]|nr:MAG: hypothetical protein E3J40_01925 [Dehalococcoidia bacterium]
MVNCIAYPFPVKFNCEIISALLAARASNFLLKDTIIRLTRQSNVLSTGQFLRQATVQPFLMDSVPSQLRATMFGIYFGLALEGQSLIQPVAGHFMDIFGIAAVFNGIALISVGLSLVALLLAKKA